MHFFDHQDFDNHEQVIFCSDATSGLQGIIAIHSTVLGPAAGGCRMHPYLSTGDALTDVLRLSKGMSYKNSVAGLPLGGGKCVIIADPSSLNKPELLRTFSTHIQSLAGRYWTAIDVGVGPADADIMAENCDYIFARASQYEAGFNPSSFTSLGGFTGIKAAAAQVWGRCNLSGLKIAIQGLGATGADMARQLAEAGAKLYVADVRDDLVSVCTSKYGAVAVHPESIHKQDVDIFSPCAMGAILNPESIPQIKAKVICGLANNQLSDDSCGELLRARGIIYVPDYVVNAGGMMGASTVIFEKPSHEKSISRITALFDSITSILEKSAATGKPTSLIADELAQQRIVQNY